MKKRGDKVIWYVLAVVVLIIVLMVVFRDEIGFSPAAKSRVKTSSPQNEFYDYMKSLGGRNVDAKQFFEEIKKLKPKDRIVSAQKPDVSNHEASCSKVKDGEYTCGRVINSKFVRWTLKCSEKGCYQTDERSSAQE